MEEKDKQYIWDMLIKPVENQLAELTQKQLRVPLGQWDAPSMLQELKMDAWGKLTNPGYWYSVEKNRMLDLIRHELVEIRHNQKLAKDMRFADGLYDDSLAKFTIKFNEEEDI